MGSRKKEPKPGREKRGESHDGLHVRSRRMFALDRVRAASGGQKAERQGEQQMELGIMLAGFVMMFLAVRNHHRQVLQKLDDIDKMLSKEIESVSNNIANED